MKNSRRRWLLRSGVGLLGMLAVVQLVPYGHDRTNPVVVAEPAWDLAATRTLAKQACFDCHSNETEWPAYARLAPASWLIQRDVVEGREALNFSEWHRPQKEADEAAQKIREREMPPAIYSLMHGHARLSDADRNRLAQGLANTLGDERAEEHRER